MFDVGESRAMPIEFPEEASGFGAWRTFVLAAGLADVVSRTVTAPIDRLKTQLQVSSTVRCLFVSEMHQWSDIVQERATYNTWFCDDAQWSSKLDKLDMQSKT